MLKHVAIAAALAGCTTPRPQVVQPTIPVHSFTVGGKPMFGAWAGEDCEAVAEYLCVYETGCVARYTGACSPESKQPVVAPSYDGWEALWTGCFAHIDDAGLVGEGDVGFDCEQLVPAGVFQ